jgi:hypothetical protein
MRDIACHRPSPGENHVRLDDQRSTVLDERGLTSISMQATLLIPAFLDMTEREEIIGLYDRGGECYEYLPAWKELVLRFSVPW